MYLHCNYLYFITECCINLYSVVLYVNMQGRAETEPDGSRAETRFGFPAKRTSAFISVGVLVQSAADSRCVRIGGSNAG